MITRPLKTIKKRRPGNRLPSQGIRFLAVMIGLSLLIHLLSYVNLSYFFGDFARDTIFSKMTPPVKIRILDSMPSELRDAKKILESHQERTEKPKETRHLGYEDHKAEKETKTKPTFDNKKGLDPGQKGNPDANRAKEKRKIAKIDDSIPLARNRYEEFLPRSVNDIPGMISAGYQEFIDDEIDIGDQIDINTAEYRYVGYFTSLRKSIELVWVYPTDAARRGMQGKVEVVFVINKDGRVGRIRIVKSSGYDILDQSIIETLKLASPYAPLPESFGKKIVVGGVFHYVISSFASGAH